MSAFNSAESEHASREAQLLESYQPSAGVFDELSNAGGVRPRWRDVLDAFAAMGPEATRSAHDKAQRLLAENGVTFIAQGERSRPWQLDLFPLLVDPDEWAAIELGVIQRARLLSDACGMAEREETREPAALGLISIDRKALEVAAARMRDVIGAPAH